jgi:hypothetical protein
MRYTPCGSSGVAGSPSHQPMMPKGGSVNQMLPSRAQTMSLGEFSGLPW